MSFPFGKKSQPHIHRSKSYHKLSMMRQLTGSSFLDLFFFKTSSQISLYTHLKTTIDIPMFNRKYIFNPGPCSSQLCWFTGIQPSNKVFGGLLHCFFSKNNIIMCGVSIQYTAFSIHSYTHICLVC